MKVFLAYTIIKNIFLFLLFITSFFKSQKVNVRGIAKDTIKNSSFVMVVINDTLMKHKGDGYDKLLNSNYRVFTDKQGNYKIKAKPIPI